MNHYCQEWIEDWCRENGWTDLIIEGENYWAFPPGAVVPEPLPPKALKLIKIEKGLSRSERLWSISAIMGTAIAGVLAYLLKSPMPLLFAFVWGAVTVAKLEID